jgi:hypothetical protein
MFDEINGTVRHGDLPVVTKVIHRTNATSAHCNNAATTASVASCHNSASRDSSDDAERNFCANVTRSLPVTAVFSQAAHALNAAADSVSIDMALAREGAAIAAAIARRERLQLWQDLVSDAAYDYELGNLPHRELGEAVVAALINAGVLVLDR